MNPSPLAESFRPDRLLIVVAHPADAETMVGGTIASWIAQGTGAELVCGTSGDAGGDTGNLDPTADPLELAAAGEAEQRAAAAIIGYRDVTFLHRPDGALVNDLALREQLVRHIRRVRPDALATFDPRAVFADGTIAHIDHRAIGQATLDAVAPAANAMAFASLARSEGLEPIRVTRLLLFGGDEAHTQVAVGPALEAKMAALAAFATQRPAATAGSAEAWQVVELGSAPSGD